MDDGGPDEILALLDYRRQVAGLYGQVRAAGADGPAEAWQQWRTGRDRLIGRHSQSPLPADRRTPSWVTPFGPYDPAARVLGSWEAVETGEVVEIPHSADGTTRFVEVGLVRFSLSGVGCSLRAFWLDAYGGGLFVPFRDLTNGDLTYGGGRYLLDTVKGADLGLVEGRVVLDFNYAYHPSCAWSDVWSCPLAPPSNWLDVAVEAGEHLPLRT
ncbi:DUF1684 domain-containing protein [Euzebya tangerina]|uniref:DUF1684 domain-containing protein n=1 Tax=Euzebya tangerina TaxID=591198 RepID=UPI000E31B8D5|nr:DUF1684 domain-containing protein [Euzebya tangerina]